METKDFENFVASQQEAAETTTDWAKTRDRWLEDLDALYRKVADFLEEYVKAGSISYDFTEIELTEPGLGRYLAKRMDIKIGRQYVFLVPLGTMLFGFKGRVEAPGSAGRAQIFLVDERVKRAADLVEVTVNLEGKVPPSPPAQEPSAWAWKILSNALQRTFVNLDKESFFELLMEVGNA